MFSGGHRGPYQGGNFPQRPGLLRAPSQSIPSRPRYQYPAPYPQVRPTPRSTTTTNHLSHGYNNSQRPSSRGPVGHNYSSFNQPAARPKGFQQQQRFRMNEGASTSYGGTTSPYFGQQQSYGRPFYGGANSYGGDNYDNGDGDHVVYNNPASQLTDNFMRLRNTQQNYTVSPSYSRGTGDYFEEVQNSEFQDMKVDDWSVDDFETTNEEPVNDVITPTPVAHGDDDEPDVKMMKDFHPERMLTVNPTILKKMNYKDHKDDLVFEIFGIVSSEVTKGIRSAVHFCLKSNNDVIPCVFYEIDRPIGNVVRNQLYRCIGHYNTQKNMQCFSVRPATVAEKTYLNRMLKQSHEIEP